MIRINDDLTIPGGEVSFTASRGGGPGGQHVNKVSSRMTLRFDIAASPSLTERQRQMLLSRLASRLTGAGVLQMSSHASRSQAANRELLLERFVEVLAGGLKRPRRRKATRPTRGSRERRLQSKRQRSAVKRTRSRVRSGDPE